MEQTTLLTLVKEALKVYSKPLIQAGGKSVFEALEKAVCVNVKSCMCIIGQILSNAIKYRREELLITFSS